MAATFIRTTAILIVGVAVGVAWYQNRDDIAEYFNRGLFGRARGSGALYQGVEMEAVN